MTALPEWDTVGRTDTDAQLVGAWMTGDRDAFGQMYDRYADRLHDFCVGMLGDFDGAADCVQDTFCIAASRLPQLRDPDKLRPWLYSIARNEALRRLRDRRRETPSDELPDEATGDAGPEALAARTELADLISEAADGLSDRDRSVLELSFRHGLGGPELAEALGVTPTYANTIVHRLRETIERSLGALLVARGVRKAGGCPEMASILDGWDGHFNVLIRKRISRHIEGCNVCDERRRKLVSPAALLGAAPLFIPAPKALRDNTLSDIRITELRDPAGTGNDDGAREPPRKGLFWSAMLLAVLGVAGGLAFVGVHQQQIGVEPAEVSETLPVPSPPKPTATNTPSGGDPSAPGTQSAGPTPTVQETPTTTTSAPPPSAAPPPVDETPPVFIPVTPPEVTTVERPEAETPPSPSRDRPSTRTTPTSDVRPPPGIAGGPVGSAPPPTRRTSINSIPGLSGGGRATSDDSDSDSDSDRSGSTRRGTGRS